MSVLQVGCVEVGLLQVGSGEVGLLQVGRVEDAVLPAQVDQRQICLEVIQASFVFGFQPLLMIRQDALQLLIRNLPKFGFGGGRLRGLVSCVVHPARVRDLSSSAIRQWGQGAASLAQLPTSGCTRQYTPSRVSSRLAFMSRRA
jgi:hypothetical protein